VAVRSDDKRRHSLPFRVPATSSAPSAEGVRAQTPASKTFSARTSQDVSCPRTALIRPSPPATYRISPNLAMLVTPLLQIGKDVRKTQACKLKTHMSPAAVPVIKKPL